MTSGGAVLLRGHRTRRRSSAALPIAPIVSGIWYERFDYCGHEISVMQRELRSQANPLSQIGTRPSNKVA
jgi:hypothetical protein